MTTLEALQRVDQQRIVDADGEQETVRLLSPASPQRVAEIERESASRCRRSCAKRSP